MNGNVKEIVAELDRISQLVADIISANTDLNNNDLEAEHKRKEIYNAHFPKLPKAPETFEALQWDPGAFRSIYKNKVKINSIGLVVSILLMLILRAANSLLYFYMVIALIIFAILFISSYLKFSKDKREHSLNVERRSKFKDMAQNSHKDMVKKFQSELDEYYVQYQYYCQLIDESNSYYLKEKNKILDRAEVLLKAKDEITLLSQEHLYLAGRVRDLLASGRADTLKEGLNLAIQEEREDKFRAQQLAESARRTEILEQQAYDNLLHNQKMEREAAAQRQHAEMQSNIAKAQLNATKQQNEYLRKLTQNQGR